MKSKVWTREQAVAAEHLRKKLEDIQPLLDEFEVQYMAARGPERAKITRARKPFEAEKSWMKKALKDLPPSPMSEGEAINIVQEILVEFCQEYEEAREDFAKRAVTDPKWAVEVARNVLVLQCQHRMVARRIRGCAGSFVSLKEVLEAVREDAEREVGYYDPTSGSGSVFHRAAAAADHMAYLGLAGHRGSTVSWHLQRLYDYELDLWAERVQVWQVLR